MPWRLGYALLCFLCGGTEILLKYGIVSRCGDEWQPGGTFATDVFPKNALATLETLGSYTCRPDARRKRRAERPAQSPV
jgi:hypothetical protein